jgi:uncharacterized repeat protein (TIGR01451 family)
VSTEPGLVQQRNAASATGAGTDANAADNLDTVTVCATRVKLKLSKRADRTAVRAGGLASYTIRVSNPSKGTARNVRTCDRLPAGLVYVSSRAKATFASGRYCWQAKALGPGTSTRYRITVRARPGTSRVRRVTNRATLRGANVRARRASATLWLVPPPDREMRRQRVSLPTAFQVLSSPPATLTHQSGHP